MSKSSITRLLLADFLSFLSPDNYHWNVGGTFELTVKEADEHTALTLIWSGADGWGRQFFQHLYFGVAKETIWSVLSSFCSVKMMLDSGLGPFRRSQTTGQLEFVRERIRRGETARGREVVIGDMRLEELRLFLHDAQKQMTIVNEPDYCTLTDCYVTASKLASYLNNPIEQKLMVHLYHRLKKVNINSEEEYSDEILHPQYADGVDFDFGQPELRPYNFVGLRVTLPDAANMPLPVEIVFADKRRPGIQHEHGLYTAITSIYCNTYGYETLALAPAYREWVTANGRQHPTQTQIHSFTANELLLAPAQIYHLVLANLGDGHH